MTQTAYIYDVSRSASQFTGKEQPAESFRRAAGCQLRCRMRGGMDSLQGPDCSLGVELRRLDIRMTEHLLNTANVRSILVHQRCHRVTEQMARATLAQLGAGDITSHNPRQVVAAEWHSVAAQKHRVCC